MEKYRVNIRQEKIYSKTVWAESKEHAVFKVYREAEAKGIEEWNTGRTKAFCEKERKWI